jgi:hypothetical protein
MEAGDKNSLKPQPSEQTQESQRSKGKGKKRLAGNKCT